MTRRQPTTAKQKKTIKPTQHNWRYIDIVMAVVFVTVVGFSIKHNFFDTDTGDTSVCHEPTVTETVYLDNDSFSTPTVNLEHCGKLLIVNSDNLQYDLATGIRSNHTDYAGFNRQIVEPGEYVELDAIEPATITLHDHLRDNAALQITINK
jgi:hypothetical protein